MFKNIDKKMMLKLAILQVVVVVISNALVSIPVEILDVKHVLNLGQNFPNYLW